MKFWNSGSFARKLTTVALLSTSIAVFTLTFAFLAFDKLLKDPNIILARLEKQLHVRRTVADHERVH